MSKQIALADIRIDGGTQQRPVEDAVVLKYKALMEDGVEFPPISVVHDGKDYFLFDGFHRYHAASKLKKTSILANVDEGTKRDAIWFSFNANAKHGFPRQPGTVKEMLLKRIFPDKKWKLETDEALAGWIGGVNRSHVTRCRKEYEASLEPKPPKQQNNPSPKNEEKTTVTQSPMLDSTGREVPEHIREIFGRVGEIKEHIRQLNQMFKTIKEAVAKNDVLYANCKLDQLKAEVGNVRRNLRFTLPYAVCAYCGGDVNNEDCRACEGRGFVNEQTYLATPDEMKK